MNRNSPIWGPPKKFATEIAERKISWLELFYDLVYVIAISRITHNFADHPDMGGLGFYIFSFGMIYWSWLNGSMYYDIHGTPGIRTDFTTLWQMLCVAAICVTLNFKNDPNYFYLTLSLACMQGYITYLWWSVGIYDKEHRKLNVPFNICYLMSLALLITCMYIPQSPIKTTCYWLILAVNYVPLSLSIN